MVQETYDFFILLQQMCYEMPRFVKLSEGLHKVIEHSIGRIDLAREGAMVEDDESEAEDSGCEDEVEDDDDPGCDAVERPRKRVRSASESPPGYPSSPSV